MDGHISTERFDSAPMLRAWQKLGPTVARLIRCDPNLASRLALAPRPTIHAIAAFLHHRRADAVDATVLAKEIATRDARDLLAEAVPNLHPRLFRLLDRVVRVANELVFYRDLNTELHAEAADMLLEARSIRQENIDIARQVRSDHVLLAARRAIGDDDALLRNLTSVLGLLRSLGLANHIERLPSGSGIQAVARRIKADLRGAKSPKIPFDPPAGWSAAQDIGHLMRVGELLQNCLSHWAGSGAQHARAFLTGSSVFLVREGTPTMLASVDRIAAKTWSMGEFGSTGADDDLLEEAKQEFAESLRAAMASTGHTLIGTDPFVAILELGWRARR